MSDTQPAENTGNGKNGENAKNDDYTALLQDFETIFQTYNEVQSHVELPDNLRKYVQDKKSWLKRLRSPEFPVAFLGSFSAGKSMVINAILGRDILPEATKSYTAIPTHVKQGKKEKEYAVVHYLGGAEKTELRALYIGEVCKALGKSRTDIQTLINLSDDQDLLGKLQEDIQEYVKNTGAGFSGGNLFAQLQNLLKQGNQFNGQTQEIPLSDLPMHVTENNKNVLFIDRVEVFLNDADWLEPGVTLVDLPGLGVVNPRHKKITQEYVEKDAKAFVVTTGVFKLLEGEEILLLNDINRQRPQVLQRAFWLINKWDTVNAKQREEEEANFKDKIQTYKFNITQNRVFKVSALGYLLLKLIVTNKFQESSVHTHIETLRKIIAQAEIPQSREKAEQLIEETEETSAFAAFQKELVAYLVDTAKREFLDEAKSARTDLARRITEQIHDDYQPDVNEEQLANDLITRRTQEQKSKVSKELHQIVEDKMMRFQIDLENLTFWQEPQQTGLENEINRLAETIPVERVITELGSARNVNKNYPKLVGILSDEFLFGDIYEQHLQDLMRGNVVDTWSQTLRDELGQQPLPDKVSSELNDLLGGRDIASRLKGLCDALLLEYDEKVNKTGFEVGNQIQKNVQNDSQGNVVVEQAIKSYKDALIDYSRGLQESVNRHIRSSVSNYFKERKVDLLKLFEKYEPEFAVVVRRQVEKDSADELNNYMRRQRTINNTYETLNALQVN